MYILTKTSGYAMCAIPMKDEGKAGMFAYNDWVYCLDGKKHGRLPAVVLPDLVPIFGGESTLRKAGYRKCWLVFQDLATGEYTFGNKVSFARSKDEEDREIARNMPTADIALLQTL